jgi:hypothetical protein
MKGIEILIIEVVPVDMTQKKRKKMEKVMDKELDAKLSDVVM